MRIKYLATYQGPSYGSYDAFEVMEGFVSVEAARHAMWNRQSVQFDWVDEYRRNQDGNHVVWATNTRAGFPASSNLDTMELYEVIERYSRGDIMINPEPCIRLSVGPRGGVVQEKF